MTVQLPAVNVHAENVPVPLVASVIVPVGVLAVPSEVSTTVIVQLVELFTAMVIGWQDIVVLVVLTVTVIVVFAAAAAEWLVSPA